MITNNSKGEHFWRNLMARTILIFITVAIIVWFLPRNEGPRFHYDIGKPWMYGSFIAKFDFPVYKTDEAIKKEQDSLLTQFLPYYTYNEDIEKQKINQFKKDYQAGIPGLPLQYKDLIVDRLHRLYQAGIMNTQEYNNIFKDSSNMIRVINGKNAQSEQIGCIYSTMAAYEKLFLDEKI